MTHPDLNPFAAPGVQDELSKVSDWEMTTLLKGLKFWLLCLCVGIFLQLLKSFVVWSFGTNTSGLWYLIYFAILLASILNEFACIAASRIVFRAAPQHAARRLAAAVLLFAIIAPVGTIALPAMSRILAVPSFAWMRISEGILRSAYSISFMVLLRMIAKRLEQQDARGIAGLVICLELGLMALPIAFGLAGVTMQITGGVSSIYLMCIAGVLFVKGIVVYLLVSHLRSQENAGQADSLLARQPAP